MRKWENWRHHLGGGGSTRGDVVELLRGYGRRARSKVAHTPEKEIREHDALYQRWYNWLRLAR